MKCSIPNWGEFIESVSEQLINRDTVLCISISGRPSNFGTTVHNAAYRACSLNYIYKAFAVTDVAGAIAGVRALGICGCSVSMPFKETVTQYLDELDETASVIGAVNTVVNKDRVLKGFNTDAYGAEMALRRVQVHRQDVIMMLGAGGVAKAIAFALRKMEVGMVYVANRDAQKTNGLKRILSCESVSWDERESVEADVLINATSVGMTPENELMPVSEEYLASLRAVVDVVVSPLETKLIRTAKAKGLMVAEGWSMSLHQSAEQFRLYTRMDPPLETMQDAVMNMLQGRIEY